MLIIMATDYYTDTVGLETSARHHLHTNSTILEIPILSILQMKTPAEEI